MVCPEAFLTLARVIVYYSTLSTLGLESFASWNFCETLRPRPWVVPGIHGALKLLAKPLLTTLSCMQGACPNKWHVWMDHHSHQCQPWLKPVRPWICLCTRTISCLLWRRWWPWTHDKEQGPWVKSSHSAYALDMDQDNCFSGPRPRVTLSNIYANSKHHLFLN